MRTTIEELYYGNIMPYNRSIRAGSEYANLVGLSDFAPWAIFLRTPLVSKLPDGFAWNANLFPRLRLGNYARFG